MQCLTVCTLSLAIATLTLSSCKQQIRNSDPPSAPQATAPKQDHNAAAEPQSPALNGSQVTLAFNELNLEDLVPFLCRQTGKTVIISPQFNSPEIVPKYYFTLLSSEPMSRTEALTRIMARLRSDGLDVQETDDSILIAPGNYPEVWRPSWWPKPKDGSS